MHEPIAAPTCQYRPPHRTSPIADKLTRTLMILLLASLFGLWSAPLYAAADPSASQATGSLLAYLTGLPLRSDKRLISGQWSDWNGFGTSALACTDRIHALTGQRIGLVGMSAWKVAIPPAFPTFTLNSSIPNSITYFGQGGLIEVAPFFPNPESGYAASKDLVITGNFADIYTDNGNAKNVGFKARLDTLAAALQQLENAGVVVLFRPFHEMTQPFFWWGANGNNAQFIALWQYTFNYLTTTKGLHNLLWVWAPFKQTSTSVMGKYPGAAYVDIVGIDAYGYKTGGELFNYDELVATGKPFALTEFGLQNAGATTPEDLNAAIQQIKTHMPRTVYFMAWNESYALDLQNNLSTALNDPWVQNRRTPPSADTQPPSRPTGLAVN